MSHGVYGPALSSILAQEQLVTLFHYCFIMAEGLHMAMVYWATAECIAQQITRADAPSRGRGGGLGLGRDEPFHAGNHQGMPCTPGPP